MNTILEWFRMQNHLTVLITLLHVNIVNMCVWVIMSNNSDLLKYIKA